MANFPTSVSTNANLYIAVNGLQTTLNSPALATDTTLTLLSTSGFPSTGAVTVENNEVVFYTGVSGSQLTGCTRGADGTTALAHSTGVTVGLTIVAAHHNLHKDEIIAIETALGAGFAKGNITAGSSKVSVTGGTGAIIGSGVTVDIGTFNLGQLSNVVVPTPSTNDILAFNGTNWVNVSTPANALPLAGGTMTGNITMSNQTGIIFKEPTGAGSGAVTVEAANSAVVSYTIKLPPTVASAGQVLTDVAGNGVLSWQTFTSGITQLTGDVTAGPGAGSQAATVALVSGQTASAVAVAAQNVINNLIDNGGFEIWQRGAGPFTGAAPLGQAYTADRWSTYFSASEYTVTVTKETTTTDNSPTSMKVVTTLIVSDFAAMRSGGLENVTSLRGKTITLSVRCNTSVAGMCNAQLSGSTSGSSTAAVHSGSGTWETLTTSLTVASNETDLRVYLQVATGTHVGTSYWDNAIVTIGTQAPTFVPLAPQADLDRCQRFFYVFGVGSEVFGPGQAISGTQAAVPLRFPVPMRTSPTVTVNSPTSFYLFGSSGNTLNTTAVSIDTTSVNSFRALVSVSSGLSAGNATYFQQNTGTLFVSADF